MLFFFGLNREFCDIFFLLRHLYYVTGRRKSNIGFNNRPKISIAHIGDRLAHCQNNRHQHWTVSVIYIFIAILWYKDENFVIDFRSPVFKELWTLDIDFRQWNFSSIRTIVQKDLRPVLSIYSPAKLSTTIAHAFSVELIYYYKMNTHKKNVCLYSKLIFKETFEKGKFHLREW